MAANTAQLVGWYRGALSDVLSELDQPALHQAVDVISRAHDDGTKVWVMGNGGSALAAQHCETDWSKSVWEASGKALRIRALVNNIGNVTAYGNDLGFDNVFANQLAALGAAGEIALFISGSGNSPNILRAAEKAKSLGMKTISMSGFGGGKVASLVDTPIVISVQDMQIIEDLHVVFCHLVMKHLMNKGAK
jgi:D-sedoheptulose 7-phosphate isomerase